MEQPKNHLGTPWAPGGGQDAIKIDPGALLEASGGEKNFSGSGRGGSGKVLGPVVIVLRPPRSDFGLPWGVPGGPLAYFSKNTKTLDFEYIPMETMVLYVPGGHFWSFFNPKCLKKPLSARNRPK